MEILVDRLSGLTRSFDKLSVAKLVRFTECVKWRGLIV